MDHQGQACLARDPHCHVNNIHFCGVDQFADGAQFDAAHNVAVDFDDLEEFRFIHNIEAGFRKHNFAEG